MEAKNVRRIILAGIISNVMAITAVATEATAADIGTRGHIVKSRPQTRAVTPNNAGPQRSCSWVGPGGRAIYLCR
jgi:hypothetical protein